MMIDSGSINHLVGMKPGFPLPPEMTGGVWEPTMARPAVAIPGTGPGTANWIASMGSEVDPNTKQAYKGRLHESRFQRISSVSEGRNVEHWQDSGRHRLTVC